MINKIYRLFGRTFGKRLRFEDYAKEAITLCAQEEQEVSSGIYLPEHLQRVTGATINCVLSTTMERMHQTHMIHAPTIMYQLGKTRLFGGGLWTHQHQFLGRRVDRNDQLAPVHLKQAVLSDSDVGAEYFGHWMREVVPASFVGTPEIPSLSLRVPSHKHAAGYAAITKMHTLYANQGLVENLCFLSDFSQNSYKLQRYLRIRENLKDSLDPKETGYKGVFIARGQSGSKRTLLNENEVIRHLQSKGFDVIYPEKMPSEDIARRLWNAKIVVTVEGSAQNHAIYSMAASGALLLLQPPSRFGIIIKGACDCMGIGWGFYVCAPSNDGEGFYVDNFADLDKVMDKLQSR